MVADAALPPIEWPVAVRQEQAGLGGGEVLRRAAGVGRRRVEHRHHQFSGSGGHPRVRPGPVDQVQDIPADGVRPGRPGQRERGVGG
ncbi:hypothetical protein AB0C29_23880 [Actinoplanes sp. NPDC048791]|uniref:hypothetical protein n=1 Tax=Actinoplanes sp. NPDC048791 TaxID=3154623 RepID=UPI0033F5E37F